ncbi:polysaccharide pyruvyl transferase family protein [Formosa sp. PL04]|uniref:polysaccharide pyruvyl transferase family protein n=1 Tax=Formosa sp. PL04 TaxID=3081755 RepID=UPI00298278B4|nr:polysaccharide pyruvyl transferase family protein [Formosa sp. PL04]MDW5287868.1 polysaccharide pyruvyl transferase family protein [Formosa sp. PL04]
MLKKTTINILGAYDRHNYGDLLFPIILKEFITNEPNNDKYLINIYSIVESDLSEYGALKTKKLSHFYDSIENDSSILIVAGGDILTAQWSSVLLALKHPAKIFMRGGRVTSKLFNRNKLAKFFLGGKSDFPFVIKKSDFPRLKAVVYNSVGGTNFHKFSNLYDSSLFGDYLSVRDENIFNNIKKESKSVKLVPDSAVIMSEYYPLDNLNKLINPNVRDFVEKQPFVFFQINKTLSLNKVDKIAQVLKTISSEYNLKICLCPIGRAGSHEDHIPLNKIHSLLKDESFYIDQPSIWDTMFLIARSEIYIGTSLHGAITAMSYNVPYMGIEVTKLNQYLKTWSFEPLNKTYKISDILVNFKEIKNADKQQLSLSRNNQVDLVRESFKKIIYIVDN